MSTDEDLQQFRLAVISLDCDEYARHASTVIRLHDKTQGRRRAIPRQRLLNAINHLVERFRPETEYVPKEERTSYRHNPDSAVPCSNPDCAKICRGGQVCVNCADCGFSAYCSKHCCDLDRTAHKQLMCTGTVNYAVRKVVPELIDIVTNYFDPARKAIQSLRAHQWIDPLDPTNPKLQRETPAIANYGLWLSYRIIHEYLKRFIIGGLQNGKICCFCCHEPTEFAGIEQLEWDLRDYISEEVSPVPVNGEVLRAKIEKNTQLGILGITAEGCVKCRLVIFCSQRCRKEFDFIHHDFLDVLLYADPLNGDPRLYLDFNQTSDESKSGLGRLLNELDLKSPVKSPEAQHAAS